MGVSFDTALELTDRDASTVSNMHFALFPIGSWGLESVRTNGIVKWTSSGVFPI